MNNNFDQLYWHDNKVYSITFPQGDNCLKMDIDFIIEWVKSDGEFGYKFLLAPSILKFENVSNLSVSLTFDDFAEIFIDEIKRSDGRSAPNGKVILYDFNIISNVGEITFTSTGFKQELTDVPHLSEEQTYFKR